jgi:uncharacterized protein (TIGR03083 family)
MLSCYGIFAERGRAPLKPVEPIHTVDLFPDLHARLLELLRGLSDEDWYRPTVAPRWSVKDMAAHLLDTDMGRLSYQRDGLGRLQPGLPIDGYRELVVLINRRNEEWVVAARRISPRVLIELLDLIAPQVHRLFKSLDPFAPARAAVAWAGDDVSPNWFDVAREYTEKWLHQQQIRDAVGAPGLTGRRWLHPVLDTFVRGLPHTYRGVSAPDGTAIGLRITGEAGGDWTLRREGAAWQIYAGSADDANARLAIDQDSAWRLFTKGLTPGKARTRALIDGDEALAARLLDLVAIMA